jgi:hypothetical protein
MIFDPKPDLARKNPTQPKKNSTRHVKREGTSRPDTRHELSMGHDKWPTTRLLLSRAIVLKLERDLFLCAKYELMNSNPFYAFINLSSIVQGRRESYPCMHYTKIVNFLEPKP